MTENNIEIKSSVGWHEFFMRHAYLAASKSKDPRTKIGSILVKDKVIISEGYNGFARGIKDFETRYSNRDEKLKYICHAEFNSVINCIRNGVSPLGSTCYTQGIPCINCCKTLIQGGIQCIIYHGKWPIMEQWKEEQKFSSNMLIEAGVAIAIWDNSLNLEGLNDGKIVKV